MEFREVDVLVAGELYIDLILSGFKTWPQPGQESFAEQYRREIGGGTSITACGLAKLGSRTAVLAVVGNEDGAWVAKRFADFCVDTSRMQYEASEPTGFSLVATMSHDRAFLTYPGANRMFEGMLRKVVRGAKFEIARHVHLAYAPNLDDAAALLDEIRSGGCTISLDTGWHEAWLNDQRVMKLLQHVDIFFPNQMEASRLTGKIDPFEVLEEFQKAGCRRVALKLGSAGSALLWDGAINFAPPRLVTPVDTTGAGDCFNAGFLHAWLSGNSPATCLLIANICGALSTESYGGVSGFPSRERLRRELDQEHKL